MKITKTELKKIIQESVKKQIAEQAEGERPYWAEEGYSVAENLANLLGNEIEALVDHPYYVALMNFTSSQSEADKQVARKKMHDFVRTLQNLAEAVRDNGPSSW